MLLVGRKELSQLVEARASSIRLLLRKEVTSMTTTPTGNSSLKITRGGLIQMKRKSKEDVCYEYGNLLFFRNW